MNSVSIHTHQYAGTWLTIYQQLETVNTYAPRAVYYVYYMF